MDKQDEEIILAMLAIADALNINVIAEGVETQGQLDFLVTAGCDLFQGYYFSKPVSSENFKKIVMRGLYMPGDSALHG